MYQLARVAPDRTVTPTVLPASYFGDMARGGVMRKKTQRFTTSEIVDAFREVHGDYYDYSRVDYVNGRVKVIIGCPTHGWFEQVPYDHKAGRKCQRCANEEYAQRRTAASREKIIKDFQAIHADLYDYGEVVYRHSGEPVRIVCRKHGAFEQKPVFHKQGQGCPKCAQDKRAASVRVSRATWLERFEKAHEDLYQYPSQDISTLSKMRIVCERHGEFLQKPQNHANGEGCPKCAANYSVNLVGLEQGMLKVQEIVPREGSARGHVYYRVVCQCGNEKVLSAEKINAGQMSCGCTRSSGSDHPRWLGPEEGLRRYKQLFRAEGYDYSKFVWGGVNAKVTLVCEKHGQFESMPSAAFNRGHKCPACATEERFQVSQHSRSSGEREVDDYIASIGFETQHGYLPDSDNRWTFDVVVPGPKLAVEFNGVYWHSYPRAHRGQHYHKRKNAEEHGYRLITIWEDDWRFNRSRMESLLRRVLLGPQTKIGARVTEVSRVDHGTAKAFHEEHHIQDFRITVANQHYALFDSADLVAVASFDRKGTLHRYTVLDGLSIAGGLSKLTKAFRGEHGPLPIVTFCDRDYFDARVYRAAGFEKTSGQLTMSYAVNGRRQRREAYMKHKLPALFGAIDETEKEIDICATNGVFACWNSGTERFELSA